MSRDFAFPGTPRRYAEDRIVDIEHIALVLDVDPVGRTIAGTATIRARVLASHPAAVELDAVELDILAVTLAGEPAPYRHDGRRLRIDLPAPAAGTQLVLAIAYRGSPRRGLYFIAPEEAYPKKPTQVWSQGQDEDSRYWFPCFDAPHEKATTEITVTVPPNLFAVSNGVLVSDQPAPDGRRTLHWRLDVPHSAYLVTLAIGDFATLEARWRDVPVVTYVVRGREADAERTLARTPAMLELLSARFGMAYPYARYAQVFVADFILGGMENTTATTLTDTILLDERAALDYDADALVVHELAHQWFGDLVTCRDWGEAWLNEGFATYTEYLWREHRDSRDAADLDLEVWGTLYFGEDSGRYRRPIATKVYDQPIHLFDHHLYDKAARVLHMLRDVLGDDAFYASLAHYLKKHRHGLTESRDLARAIEDATGRVVDWFFSQWVIDGAGHPELDVRIAWDAATRLASVTVAQTHELSAVTPLFRLPTRVRFRLGDADVDVPIEIRDAKQAFHVRLDGEPTQAIFDPGRVLLAGVRVDKPESMWLAELAGATLGADRSAAANVLGKRGGPLAERALIDAIGRDRFWGTRGAIATALGQVRTDRARDALIARLADELEPRARRIVARALGEYVGDETAATALGALVERGDPSYFVEAEAALALGRTRGTRAGEILRAAATRETFADIVRAYAYRGLADARDDAAVPLLLDGTRWGRVSQGRRAACTALASLMRGRRDREARDVRERLELLLSDRDFRVQQFALEALLTVGDPASIPAIERMMARELEGRLVRRGREVARDLAAGTPIGDEVRRLRDELGEVRALAGSLRDRVSLLEERMEWKKDRKKKKTKS